MTAALFTREDIERCIDDRIPKGQIGYRVGSTIHLFRLFISGEFPVLERTGQTIPAQRSVTVFEREFLCWPPTPSTWAHDGRLWHRIGSEGTKTLCGADINLKGEFDRPSEDQLRYWFSCHIVCLSCVARTVGIPVSESQVTGDRISPSWAPPGPDWTWEGSSAFHRAWKLGKAIGSPEVPSAIKPLLQEMYERGNTEGQRYFESDECKNMIRRIEETLSQED